MKIKYYIIQLSVVLALVLASCQKPDLENPMWQVDMDKLDGSSSMTLIADVSGGIHQDDMMAAFIGNVCCGVGIATYPKGGYRFMLNIFEPMDDALNGPITLVYYCAEERHLHYWHNELRYQPEAIIGTLDDPYVLSLRRSTKE